MKKNVFIEKFEEFKIPNEKEVSVVMSGNFADICCSNKERNNLMKYKRLSRSEYVDTDTGEVFKYAVKSHKTIENLKESFRRIVPIVRGNFFGEENERFITLTYAKPNMNPETISKDFNDFIRDIRRITSNICWFSAKEPHETGAWHVHVLLKLLDKSDFDISYEKITELWKKGQVYVEKINDIDRLVYYFDISRSSDKSKRIIFYQNNIQIFNHSRNMTLKKQKTSYSEAKKLMNEQKKDLIYKRGYKVTDIKSGNVISKVYHEQYR